MGRNLCETEELGTIVCGMKRSTRRTFCKQVASAVMGSPVLLSRPSFGYTRSLNVDLLQNTRPAVQNKLKLEGGFIEFWGGMLTDESFKSLGACAWRQVLQAMRDLKMDTVVIKRTQVDDTDFTRQSTDLTRIVLDYAGLNPKMNVYIGLRNTSVWNPTAFRNSTWRESEKKKNIDLVRKVWSAYGTDESFAGWYISQEIGNEPDWYNQLADLRDYYRSICGECKRLASHKPVLLSPYYNPYPTPGNSFLPANHFAEEYGRFLDQLKDGNRYLVDTIMLQDSVGERRILEPDLVNVVVPYFNAFAKICSVRKLRLWGNIESFNNRGGNQLFPTEARRLSAQIKVIPNTVEKLITFDFFHFMNPYNHLYYDIAFKTAQRALYQGYSDEFVKNSNLSPVICP